MGSLTQILSEAKKSKNDALPAKELVEKIYSGYMDADSWKQKKSFAPSGLFYGSGACGRRWVLSFQGNQYESKASPLNFANMKAGIKSHERIQEAMEKAGIAQQIEAEVRLNDPPILGYADAILDLDGELYVGEIKTTSHRNFEYRRTSNKIADYHLAQVLIYMFILQYNKGVVIYESKDTNELFAILIEMTPEYKAYVEGVLDWCRMVWSYYQQDLMPVRSFRKGSKVCKSCPMEEACYELPEGIMKVDRLPLP